MGRNKFFISLFVCAACFCNVTQARVDTTTSADMCCKPQDTSDAKLNILINKAKSGRAGDIAQVALALDLRGNKAGSIKWHRKAATAPDGFARAFGNYALAVRDSNRNDYIKYMRLAIALKDENATFYVLDSTNQFPLTSEDARFWMHLSYVDAGKMGIFQLCEELTKSKRDDLIVGFIFKGDKSFSSWPQSLRDQYIECRPSLIQSVQEKRLVRSAVREATLKDPSNPNEVEPNLWK